MVSNQPFLFLQLPVHVHISYEAMVVDGVEGYVNLLIERVVVGEGGEVHGVSYEWGGAGSHERGCCEWPSVGNAIEVHTVGVYIVVMVDVIVVEPDIMGIGLGSVLEGDLLAILDMIFKSAVVHSKPFWLIDHPQLVLFVGGLVSKGGSDLSRHLIRGVRDYFGGELVQRVFQSRRG